MTALRYTLVADGSSDRCLLPIIDSVLNEIPDIADVGRRFAEAMTRGTLEERVSDAARQFPADVIFVHRDAEREGLHARVAEIQAALAHFSGPLCVATVPVRMTEAWLLIDEDAIRRAADNPNGRAYVGIPRPRN